MSSLQPESANRPLLAVDSSTVPFTYNPEPASRVMDKLDQLATTLDQENRSALAATTAGPTPFQAPPSNPDDECLDSYLQKYMQRLTGKSAVDPPSASAPMMANTTAKTEQLEPAPEEPRRQPTPAPECRLQITAMRDLANDSARRAVNESSQIQRILTTRRSYQQAKLASLASVVMVFAYFGTHAPLALTGSLLLFAVAVVLSVRFALLFRTATAIDA